MQGPAPEQRPDAPVVLITRPQPAAHRFAAELAGLGLRCVIAPLMRIVGVAHDTAAVAAARGVVFTSENALPHAGPGNGRPAFCVGPRTAEAARAAGFVVTEGPGDAAGLMPMLSGLGDGWLHLRGVQVAAELPVPGVIVYDQQPLTLSPQAGALLRETAPVIMPLFSPRAAAIAARAVAAARPEEGAPLWLAPISAAADAAWDNAWPAGPPPGLRRCIAARPNAASVRDAIAALAGERSDPARVERAGAAD